MYLYLFYQLLSLSAFQSLFQLLEELGSLLDHLGPDGQTRPLSPYRPKSIKLSSLSPSLNEAAEGRSRSLHSVCLSTHNVALGNDQPV